MGGKEDLIGENNGRIEVYGGHGVWVPDGMTAAEIIIGGDAIAAHHDIDKFTARRIVMTALEAIRLQGSSENRRPADKA